MIIEKITIRSFGAIRDMTLDFQSGVNVLEGQNEAGKSTIAAFIKYMLYGFGADKPAPGRLDERQKRLNWETGIADGAMTVLVKGKRYMITRSTVLAETSPKATYREESSIVDLENGTPAFGKAPAGEVFFGVDRELFENTAFIGQIGDAGINEETVCRSIENILFSGSETQNVSRALSTVRGKMETLLHVGGNGGVIYDLAKKRSDLEDELAVARENNEAILAKEAVIHAIREKKKESETKLKRMYELDDSFHNIMLIQTFDKLHELEHDCDEKTEAYNAFMAANTKDGFTPDHDYLTEVALARKGVNDTYRAYGDAEAAYEKKKSAVGITREIEGAIELSDEFGGEEKIRAKAKKARFDIVKWIAALIGGGLIAIAAAVFAIVAADKVDLVFRILALVGGGLSLVGAGISVYFLLKVKKELAALEEKFGTQNYASLLEKLGVIGEARLRRDTMLRETEDCREALERAEKNCTDAKDELTRVVLKWSDELPMEDTNEFLDRLVSAASGFLEEKARLLDEKTNSEITVREIRRQLADKSEIDVRAQVPPLKRKILAEINHDEIINGIADAKAVIAEQENLEAAAGRELAELKTKARDPGEIHARIEALDARIEELTAKHKALYIAGKALEGAQAALRREISPRLGEYTADLLGIMTDNKYTSVDVTDALEVSLSSGGEKKSADFLSGGTRDLTYIAVRMALIDMLYTENPPVIFDESFAHQDNVRARSMMKAIAHLAKDAEQQSFIFTCRGREATLATEVAENPAVFKLSVASDNLE